MTALKEMTLKLIEKMPDDKMIYVFNIVRSIDEITNSHENEEQENIQKRKKAFETLMKFRRPVPVDFDYKKELEEALREKYESLN